MKTTIKNSLLGLALALILASCQDVVRPSSRVTVQERNVTEFEGIEITSAFQVEVTYSAQETKVEIETNENLHQYIDVENVNNNLRIRIQPGLSLRGSSTLKAKITTANPTKVISASGASLVTLTNTLSAPDLNIYLTGACNLSGEIETTNLTISADGASQVYLSGTASSIDGILTGASSIEGFNLTAEQLDLNMSEASQASFTVNQLINLDASGASVLRYKGDALVDQINLSGASQIIKMN